jgi:nitric oxide synthase-interacting protein
MSDTNSFRARRARKKNFDCCCLTLQPCRYPVATPDGYLYDKEAILENIIHQKKENAKKLKEFERQKRKNEEELEELATAEARSKVEKFLATENSIVTKPVDAFSRATEAPSISNMADVEPGTVHIPSSTKTPSGEAGSGGTSSASGSRGAGVKGKRPKLPSFWIPTFTPSAKPTEIKKPDMKTYCPMSGKELRVKDLVPVKFTAIADRDSKTAAIVKQTRYMCPVTRDVLSNSVGCVLLRPSGDVVTQECVDKLIRTSNMLCPITGKTLKEKDLIPLQRGGTGYAGSGVELKATRAGAAMMA